MNKELQILVERLIAAEAESRRARAAFKDAERVADLLEVATTNADTELAHAKIAFNHMVISLASNPPASESTPEPTYPLLHDPFAGYDPDTTIEPVFSDPANLLHTPYNGPCDSCYTREHVTKREGFGVFPTYCPKCWATAFEGGPDICAICYDRVSERDRENSYIPDGQCARCNNHPCEHCGLEGGH